MLLNWAKNKKDELKAKKTLKNFNKYGNKKITTDNFLDLGYAYITYNLLGKKYQGFFDKFTQKDLFFILDYYEGKILTIN